MPDIPVAEDGYGHAEFFLADGTYGDTVDAGPVTSVPAAACKCGKAYSGGAILSCQLRSPLFTPILPVS